ncbi:hypothetical protein Hamer_G007863, partial [Homarus americanus]
MLSFEYHIIMLAAMVMNAAPVISQDVGGPVEQVGVDVGVMVSQVVEHHLIGCHLVLISTTPHSHVLSILIRFLVSAKLWKFPETRVVVVGGKPGVGDVLLHHIFRNTVHALYLAFSDIAPNTPPRLGNSRLRKSLPQE